jgi:hypothetical protein
LAHATVFGIGGHYLANLGSSLEGGAGYVLNMPGLGSIEVQQEGVSGFSGWGLKTWTEALPWVDLELTGNMQLRSYKAKLIGVDQTPGYTILEVPSDTVDMVAAWGIPLISDDTTKPIFAQFSLELSVTYPFELPPPLSFLRPYVGAGLDLVWSTPVLNAEFGTAFLNEQIEAGRIDILNDFKNNEETREHLKTVLSEELSRYWDEEGLDFGVGAHLLAGLRIKIPVAPIALYVNGKYHFGGGLAREFRQGLVLEAGGGLDL